MVKTRSIGEPEPKTGLVQGIFEGMKFIYTNRPVGVFIALVSFHCALVMSFDSILPVLSRDTLGSNDEFLLALLVLAFGTGSIIGTFLIAGIENDRKKGILFLISGVVSAIAPIALGLSSEILSSFVAKFLMGASQSTFMALSMTYVQLSAPDKMRGRISSLYILHAGGIMAFANLGYGNLADMFGATEILVVTGFIFLVTYCSMSLVDPILKKVYKGEAISL
jgi:MFS family permease